MRLLRVSETAINQLDLFSYGIIPPQCGRGPWACCIGAPTVVHNISWELAAKTHSPGREANFETTSTKSLDQHQLKICDKPLTLAHVKEFWMHLY